MLLMLLLAMTIGSHRAFAQSVTITLMPGWNWISYPNAVSMDIEDALGDFEPVGGDRLKSVNLSTEYDSEWGWEGELETLVPGQGYMYYSARTEAIDFAFVRASFSIVTTVEPTDITATSAVVGGIVSIEEGNHIFARGVCWSTEPNPDIDGNHISNGAEAGSFTNTLTELIPSTTYYVRVYVVTDYGLAYGNETIFSTLNGIPVVTTAVVTNVLGDGAICGGTVTDGNGLDVIARGVCWSTSPNPTVADSLTDDGSGMGDFISSITGLNVNTTYYVRSYAITVAGTGYGEQKTFTTQDGIPTLTTADVTNITEESAICGGDITDNGGLNITDRGVCWSTSPNPTIADQHTVDGSGIGSFSSSIMGLSMSTTYYVRAYATNSCTTAYGNEISFTTLNHPIGAIGGLFSVSASRQVYFSQGNLQYQASTDIWKFADNQYDNIGDDNSNISSTYSGWIDLFGWGTSGWNSGNTYYQPWSSASDNESNNGQLYGPLGQYNLTGTYANADWGVYNPISNGGNTANQWRTLTQPEWDYVFKTRSTASGIRYAKANVNNVNGVILLPDDWNSSTYSLSSTNTSNASFSTNTLTISQWSTLEQAGAVFLPAAGSRGGTSVGGVGSSGGYWSSSCNGGYMAIQGVFFNDSYLTTNGSTARHSGKSVRLVRNAE